MADRDKNGRFQKGHKAGGRPPKVVEVSRLTDIEEIVTRAKWRRLLERAYEMAMDGNVQAMKLVFMYVAGTPVQIVRAAVDNTVALDKEFQEALDRGYGGP